MQACYWWWLLALGLGVLELMTSTFYLLVLAVGCLGGGAVAYAGGNVSAQMLAAAVVTIIGWLVLRRLVPSRGQQPATQANPDVLLDIGERIRIDHWDAHGHAHAVYRGARWAVQIEPGGSAGASHPKPGEYQIRRMSGNTLIVAPLA